MIGMRWAVAAVLLAVGIVLSGCGQTSFTEAERLERAEAFREQGDVRAAIIELKNLLQDNPGHLEGRWRLGLLHLDAGDGPAALSDLERALSQGWESEDAPLQLARARLLQRDFDAVVERLQTWRLTRQEDVVEAHVLRGRAFIGLDRLEDARNEFGAALRNDEGHAGALTGLARVSVMAEPADMAEANALLDRALAADPGYAEAWDLQGDLHRAQEALPEAEAAFTRVIEVAPNPYLGHYKRALTRMAQQDLEGAAQDLDQMRRLGRNLAPTAHVQGLLHFYRQEYQAAADALEDALRGNPNLFPAMFFAGASHYALENWQQAETYLGRYLRAFPDMPAANQLLAAVRLRGGHVQDAQTLLERALAANPGDAAALDLMASIHATRGDNVATLEVLRQRVSMQPDSPQARMRLAAALLQSGDREAGFAELEAARELDPEDVGIDVALVVRLLQDGNFERALSEVEALIEKHPEEPVPYNLRGIALLGLNRVDDAVATFEQTLNVAPGDFTATRNLAVIRFRQGQLDAARQIIERSLEQRPTDHRLLVLLGNFEVRHGSRERAIGYFTRAMEAQPQALEPRILLGRHYLEAEEPRRALRLLEEVREHHPQNPVLLEHIANAQLASGQLESGINTLRRLAEIAPEVAEVHFRLGIAQRRADRPREARRALARAVDLDGSHARALLALAALDVEAGRHDDALAQARRVQALEGHRAAGHMLEGDIHRAREAFPQALAAYEKAYAETPSAEAAVKRFDMARRTGDLAGAQAALARRVDDHPDDHQSRLMLASSYIESGDFERAVTHYEVLAQHAPENPAILNNLAFLYHRQGDERALELARKANQLRPEDPRIKDTLGVVLLDHGDPAEALSLIAAAHEALPDSSTITYHYALALERNDRSAEAAEVLRELLADDTAFDEREEAEALLGSLE
ncbi:XrtA/PEP-CTERM system TPR-repeat protein PrsT [Thioalkalivibrio denitrificans]|nr:XrtA/PEP-CTERM system TPR-repeat protein PrsT [Thioalkalivibrio denitrificans]